jgi:hypothetical protein
MAVMAAMFEAKHNSGRAAVRHGTVKESVSATGTHGRR